MELSAQERADLKEELRKELQIEQIAKMHAGIKRAVAERIKSGFKYQPKARMATKTSRPMTVEEKRMVMYEQKKLGYYLRRMRESKGLNIMDMAIRIGISQPMITKMERGNGNFTTCMMIRYAAALGMFPTLAFKDPK